jgi:hypothetical protein
VERVKGIEPSSSAWKACDKRCEINGGLDFSEAYNPVFWVESLYRLASTEIGRASTGKPCTVQESGAGQEPVYELQKQRPLTDTAG